MTSTRHVASADRWGPSGEYPDPYIFLQSVRDGTGRLLDFHGRVFNEAATRLVSGWGPALSTWSALEGVPSLGALGRVVDGEPSLTFEVGLRRGEALERWFLARAVKREDGVELWLSDVTEAFAERRSLREALARERLAREREAYLGLALETARMVTWEWSEARGAFTLSDNAASFFGQPRDDVGNSLDQLLRNVRPEERAQIAEAFERMRYLPGPHSFFFHGEWPDGSVHIYEVVGRSFHEEGQPVRVLGVALECTERERAHEALREAEERYRLASLATNDVLWEWCVRDGRILWGEACTRVLGFLPEEMGDFDGWMERIHPEDRERVRDGLRLLHDSRDEAWSAEYRLRGKDGAYMDVLDRGRAARDVRGRLVRMIGSMMDITERKRMLAHMEEEARFRERFIGILGHDLRSPLHAIALSARELSRRELPPRQEGMVRRIESSASRMGNMISDILDLTRARLGGGIPLHLSPTSLPRVCRQVVQELEALYPTRLVVVESEGHCEGIWDWERLAQVVSNLVGNALSHASHDDPIFVRCWQEAGRQWLEISNPGPPIPPELLRTLFSPFGQGRSVRTGRGSGLGLGLFIVRELVRAHGGEVTVRSEDGAGTAFRIVLPLDSSATRPPLEPAVVPR
ncbi:ATP-binding protein [Archangium primigenium]|uniref:ATP-binding protein n=1 Tax=[Archangium] primigenium TaxID=2792470 RepID=UPI00195BDB6B